MFGYVLPVKPEMKVRDFDAYRAVYCGLCKQLGKSYHTFCRFLLNYDLVLVAVLADAVSGLTGESHCEGCFANPLARRCTLHGTPGLALAADALVLLSWHKLRDNLDDEKLPRRLLYAAASPPMRAMYKKAAQRQSELAGLCEREMERQRQLEQRGSILPDEACEPTAKMCEAIFRLAAQDEQQRRILGRMGLFCGQIVYLLDAAEDYESDVAAKRYNVFAQAGLSATEAVAAAQKRCRMAAGEIALSYNLLKTKQYRDILDNIFFLGLPQGIARAGIKRTKKGAGHGQIDSI